MPGNVAGLIADQRFQGLSPADQRQALAGVSGNQAFTSLSDADTHQFITGMQAKAISTSPPGVPRPAAPPMFQHDIFGPVDPNSFSERVGARIKQNVSLIPNAIDAMSPSAKINAPARAALQQATGGSEGTQQMLYGGAKSTLGKTAALATIAPRMAIGLSKQYVQDPAAAVGDIVTAAPELAEMRMGRGARAAATSEVPRPATAGPPVPEARVPIMERTDLTPEQKTGYVKSIDRANAALEKQQRAQTLAQNQQQLAGIIRDDVQNTHEQVRNGLNARSEEVRNATVNTTVPTEPITKAIDTSRTMLSGVPADLKVFNQIMNFMQNANMEQIGEAARVGLEQGDASALERWVGMSPEEKQAPAANIGFVDAQRQFTALGDAWANADGNVRRALANVKDAYAKSLQSGADQAGIGPQFSKLQGDWAQYFQDWQGRGPLAKMLKSMHQNYATPILKGPSGDLLIQQYGRYADPQAIREFQRISREGKQPLPPRVPPPPEPSMAQPPKTLAGRMIEHAGRLTGKVVGGAIGTKLGHPLIGYGAGGEIGAEVGRKLATRTPPTRESYTRTLLQAKEGEITPEEANRRIQRAGGSLKTRPLPQPTE